MFMLIKQVDSFFNNLLSNFPKNPFFLIFDIIGSIIFISMFILILFFLPFYKAKETAIILFISLCICTVIVFILKYSVKRKREVYDNLYVSKIDRYSFPSGHIGRISAMIIPLSIYPVLAVIYIFFCIVVSILRIRKGYHYFSDCAVGLIIGLFSGFISYNFSFLYMNLFLNILIKFNLK